MDGNRAAAWLIGAIVTLSVILIGKGFMGKPDTSGLKKNRKSDNESSLSINIQTSPVQTQPPEYDIFGKPIITVSTEVTTETTVAETDVFGNVVTTVITSETDVFGNVVTTVITSETDVFGNIVTTETTETSDTTTQATDDIPLETTTLSPFEQYQQSLNDPHSIGGFNHNQYDDEGNPVPTLPSGFAIVIE